MYVLQGKGRNPLHRSEPSDYNHILSNIRDKVEPYARYMNFTSGEQVTALRHPLRIFPRRIWDLHSNRVIPFDWLVAHVAMVENNNVMSSPKLMSITYSVLSSLTPLRVKKSIFSNLFRSITIALAMPSLGLCGRHPSLKPSHQTVMRGNGELTDGQSIYKNG